MRAMHPFGVHLIGFTPATLHKLVLTVAFVVGILLLRTVLVGAVRWAGRKTRNERSVFWTRQITAIVTTLLVLFGIGSVWFQEPSKLATVAGLIGAGVAFALQKVITSVAGYLVILRGNVFRVGDRVVMGGVRGDVVALGFVYTSILEIGEPPPMNEAPNAVWVGARQYTGRVVTVTNDKVFDSPVYNYTRELPFLWEEVKIPIKYGADRKRAEAILLRCAHRVTDRYERLSAEQRRTLEEKYFVKLGETDPRVYYRLTDNWLEMTLRVLVPDRGIRSVKDELFREILDAFEAEHVEIASGTYDVVGFPKVGLSRETIEALRAPASPRPSRGAAE